MSPPRRVRLTPIFLAAISGATSTCGPKRVADTAHTGVEREKERLFTRDVQTVHAESDPATDAGSAADAGDRSAIVGQDASTSPAEVGLWNGPGCDFEVATVSRAARLRPTLDPNPRSDLGPDVDVSARLTAQPVIPKLPHELDYYARVEGGIPKVELGMRPKDEDGIAVLKELAALRVEGFVWRKAGVFCTTWRKGVKPYERAASLRAALVPLDTPSKVVLLAEEFIAGLRWQAPNGKWVGSDKGAYVKTRADGTFEVLGMAEGIFQGACPHSSAAPGVVVYRVDRQGDITILGKATATGNLLPTGVTRHAPCVGRDTHGSGRRVSKRDTLFDYFLGLAHDESISVRSFERLERELVAANAPDALVQAAKRSASDERRHARLMSEMAKRFAPHTSRNEGISHAVHPDAAPLPIRCLDALLLENAIEGCVLETYAAMLATLQAERALEPSARRLFRRIARDETRHAELAWDIHRWGMKKLEEEQRAAIAAAMTEAVTRLHGESSLSETDRALVGEPSADENRRLVHAVFQELFDEGSGAISFRAALSPTEQSRPSEALFSCATQSSSDLTNNRSYSSTVQPA